MVFASHIFLFGFLPLFLMAYYAAPAKARSVLILMASYAFYGWWRVDYLLVVIGISLISYISAAYAASARSPEVRGMAVKAGVTLILATLGYFKYAHFIVGATNTLTETFGMAAFTLDSIILPIGISFLSFQAISYIVDVARKDAPPARNLIDFLAFVALFPQLIAGPVLRYKDIAQQFMDRTHSVAIFMTGVQRFALGLGMKLLVADTVAPLADRIFALQNPTFTEAWLGAVAYAIQLLFDFAGYSAMAIGLGLMIGFRFAENFNAPYTSTSITDFWRRWHISLSNWLRDYLYVPLGGNRRGTILTYRNLMLTMVLGGLWHGANWTFVLWGAWHGLALAIERLCGVKPSDQPNLQGWIRTMVVVLVGWVLFRAPTLDDAAAMFSGMLGANGWAVTSEILYTTQGIELTALVCGVALSLRRPDPTPKTQPAIGRAVATTMVLLIASNIVLSARAHSPFLYFQF